MTALLSCKLFCACDHKSAILAALQNPINTELVIQLEKYLGDKDVADTIANVEGKHSKHDVGHKDIQDDSKHPDSQDSKSAPARTEPHRLSNMLKDAEVPNADEDDSNDTEVENNEDSSEAADDLQIESATGVDSSSASNDDSIIECIDKLANTGPHRSDIRSIVRRGSEIWMYCKDSVNLNTIMDDLIESVRQACGERLAFNRLARTENAIVFTDEVTT